MKKNILVSIGLPVYNGSRYIRFAIDSILSQTYDNFELLITDDGSTDNTLLVLNQYHDSRIKIISDGKNKGISYRLNQQIALAQGKYFIRMDSDDIMFPKRIEKQVEYLEQHPEIDVIGSKAIVIDEQNKIIGGRGRVKNINSVNELFLGTRFLHPTVAGRIEWFKKWKYRDEVSGCEDLDLWIRSYKKSSFHDLNEYLMFYRDPLVFRLKVYLSRQVKILKSIWILRSEAEGYLILIQVFLKSILSIFLSLILYVLKMDSYLIRRRNNVNIENKKYYKSILERVCKD